MHLLKKVLPVILLLIIAVSILSCSKTPKTTDEQVTPAETPPPAVLFYTFDIINKFPHDRGAFTQGLIFEDGTLYEGTGQYRKSSLRRVELETGEILQSFKLPDAYFGEGITIYNSSIYQLTWRENKGFIYDKDSFKLLREFDYPMAGWGITHDEDHLITSDGSSTLYFIDPKTLKVVDYITVNDKDITVDKLNELEYIDGRIYANIWKTDKIAIINPQNGELTSWIDLTGLLPDDQAKGADVLNGIAFDRDNDRLFVTGKFWPLLFEIKLVASE